MREIKNVNRLNPILAAGLAPLVVLRWVVSTVVVRVALCRVGRTGR